MKLVSELHDFICAEIAFQRDAPENEKRLVLERERERERETDLSVSSLVRGWR